MGNVMKRKEKFFSVAGDHVEDVRIFVESWGDSPP